MEVFLDKYYAIINFAVVFLPAIIGLLVYKKFKNNLIKYFIWFCFYVVFVEIVGYYEFFIEKFESLQFINELIKDSVFQNSNWWYLIAWTLVGALFYSFYFRSLLNSPRLKRLLKYFAILYLIFFVVFFIKDFATITWSAQIPINIANALIIVVSVLAYYVEILLSDKILSIFSSVNFYIAASVLLWHLVLTPLSFYEVYFNRSDMDFSIMKAIIYLICNTFMYLTFTFALLWCKPQNN